MAEGSVMTPEEFDKTFTRRKTLLTRFWIWHYGFCKTCRGQQESLAGDICPTCNGTGRPPKEVFRLGD